MKGSRFLDLVALVDRLRGPGGCPWDREQTFDTLKPMLLEEVYEVLDSLDQADDQEFCTELGDLLFQIVFLSRVAEDQRQFDIDEVSDAIIEKMIRRHPHVFGALKASTPEEVLVNWEEIKKAERAKGNHERAGLSESGSVLDGIPPMSALLAASKVTSRAARVGFDWENIDQVFGKLQEELTELQQALKLSNGSTPTPEVEEEVGDLLFVVVNVARFLKIDAETALRKTNRKFTRRFQQVERKLKDAGKELSQTNIVEMEELWQEAKRE